MKQSKTNKRIGWQQGRSQLRGQSKFAPHPPDEIRSLALKL